MRIMKLQRLIFLAFALALVPLVSAPSTPPLILRGSTATNAPPSNPSVSTNAGTNTITTGKKGQSAADRLSAPARDVIQMSDAGVTPDVLTSYIQNSPSSFNLTTDDIIYLKDIGVSGAIVSSMLAHDKAMRDRVYQQAMPAEGGPPPPGDMPGQIPGTLPSEPPADDTTPPVPQYQNYQPQAANDFYDSLSPYGAWGNLPGYGDYWQPYVAGSAGWAPYCNEGRWCHSNFGWFWQSNYPWGWAAFHYGRWWNHPDRGWLWFPGNDWAPSWVNWRSSPEVVGWAPLSPFADSSFGSGAGAAQGFGFNTSQGFDRFGLHRDNFTFVPRNRFGERNLSRFRLKPAQVRSIFPQTTLVNNTFATGAGNTTVNRGLDFNQLLAASSSPIPLINVQDLPVDDTGFAPDSLAANGGPIFSSIGGFVDGFDEGFGDEFRRIDNRRILRTGTRNGPQPSTAQSTAINPAFPQRGQGLLFTGQPSTAQSQRINPMFPNLRPGLQLPNRRIFGGGFPVRGTFLAPFPFGPSSVPNQFGSGVQGTVPSSGTQFAPSVQNFAVPGSITPPSGVAAPSTRAGAFTPPGSIIGGSAGGTGSGGGGQH
jgi:hypothetical protein